jgi:LPS sulfotransferase NodH
MTPPAPISLDRPRIAYVVCATQRSGSTLLCKTLGSTGIAGRPEEFFEARHHSRLPRAPREYFETAPDVAERGGLAAGYSGEAARDLQPWSDLRRVSDYRAHLAAALSHGTTPNGVFGTKLMWSHLDDVRAFAEELAEYRGLEVADLLRAWLGDVRWIWVRRRDTVRQAVSLWRAVQSRAWRDDPERRGSGEARYDFAALDHLVRLLREHDESWRRWFAANDIEPLIVLYREIAADAARTASRRVLGHLGLPEPGDLAPVRMERQSDELSEAWIVRYNEEAAGRPPIAATTGSPTT